MGIETAGAWMQPKKKAWQSRNIAIMSIVGVIGGAWLTFRAMAPKKHTFAVSDEEVEAMRGHHSRQTDQDGKVPRPPDGTLIRKM